MVDAELRQRETERAQSRVQQLLATHPRLALVQAESIGRRADDRNDRAAGGHRVGDNAGVFS